MTYAKNALQPLGTIMLVASVAGKAARPRFEPLTFAAGFTEITPESAEYLNKIAELLEERPGLSLTFCGVSTLDDRDYLLQASEQPTAPAEAVPEGETQPPDTGPLLESERLELARARVWMS